MKTLDSIIVPHSRIETICSATYRATWRVGDRVIVFGMTKTIPGIEGTRIILGKVSSHVMTVTEIYLGSITLRADDGVRKHKLQLAPRPSSYWENPVYPHRTAAYAVKVEDLTDDEKLFITTRRIQS